MYSSGLRPVAISARHGAARRAGGAGQLELLAECAHPPVVPVVVVEQALAVVGTNGADIETAALETVVEILQHQVARGDVDEGLFSIPALACRPYWAALSQRCQ